MLRYCVSVARLLLRVFHEKARLVVADPLVFFAVGVVACTGCEHEGERNDDLRHSLHLRCMMQRSPRRRRADAGQEEGVQSPCRINRCGSSSASSDVPGWHCLWLLFCSGREADRLGMEFRLPGQWGIEVSVTHLSWIFSLTSRRSPSGLGRRKGNLVLFRTDKEQDP